MTTSSLIEIEQDFRLHSLAKAYEQLGYSVKVKPENSDLPDFLHSFQFDLIAQNGSENIVGEMRNRVRIKPYTYWLKLEEAMKGHSEWKLQVVDAGSLDTDLSPSSEVSDPKTITARISQAAKLLAGGSPDIAVVVAFGALEASMRALVLKDELEWTPGSTLSLIGLMYQSGYLDSEESRLVQSLMAKRNAIAHGFTSNNVTTEEVERLLLLATELIGYLR